MATGKETLEGLMGFVIPDETSRKATDSLVAIQHKPTFTEVLADWVIYSAKEIHPIQAAFDLGFILGYFKGERSIEELRRLDRMFGEEAK